MLCSPIRAIWCFSSSFFFFWGGEGLTSDFASNPVHKQKFCTRLTRPGVNARVSGPECYAPPRLGEPRLLDHGSPVQCKFEEQRARKARLLYPWMIVNLAEYNHSKPFAANEMFETRVCDSVPRLL